jgi:hypothetical protein
MQCQESYDLVILLPFATMLHMLHLASETGHGVPGSVVIPLRERNIQRQIEFEQIIRPNQAKRRIFEFILLIWPNLVTVLLSCVLSKQFRCGRDGK